MKVKVLNNFTDKETGKFRLEGIEFECSLERTKELAKLGYVEMLEPIIEEKPLKKEISKKIIDKKEIVRKTIAKK